MSSTSILGIVVLFFGAAVPRRALAAAWQHGVSQGQRPPAETPLAMLHRAQAFLAQGKLKDAREELERGAKAFPHEAAFFNFLGIVDAEENDPRAAESEFRRAIGEAPNYRGAYLNLAHLYEVESVQDVAVRQKALQTYRALLKFDRGDAEANYQCALLQMQQGAFRDSLNHLLRLSAEDRQRPRVLAVLCADHTGLGEPGQAREDAGRLMDAPGLTEADVLPVIPVLKASGEEPLAIRLMQSLEQRHVASAQTLEQLGTLFEHADEWQQARDSLEAAARQDPNGVEPLIELARLANRQKDYRGALGYLAHARDLKPQNAAIHFFFGIVCVELDLHHEAYVSLKRAVELNPNNAYYNYALGAVCTQRQDASEAIGYLKKYCALRPQDPRGVLALGAAYYYSHNLDLARAQLLKVYADCATAAAANYYLGRIANDDGRWPEAVEDLNRALQEHPQYADAYAALASVYLNERKYAEARKALARALKLEPDNYLANLNLMILYGRTKDPRASAQAQRFAQVRKVREQRAMLFLRTIRVVP